MKTLTLVLFVLATTTATPRPGWLGAGLTPRRTNGSAWVTVQIVAPGGPSDQAGLRAGDVITHIDNEPIRARTDLEMLEQLANIRPHQRVTIRFMRADQKLTTVVAAGEMSDPAYQRWLTSLDFARSLAARQKAPPR